jgi:hypothetical protein
LYATQGFPLDNDISNPLYGWLFLSVALKAVGYPDSLHPSADGDIQSIGLLYLVPRIFVAILAIIDTILIFKISNYYFKNKKVALIASILFAVMPMTWLTRYVLLENIQLPFLLSSILFALYARNTSSNAIKDKTIHRLPIILISGMCLGSAIFVKIPAIAMIPLIGFIIYSNDNSLKKLGLFFIPVILIPLISPAYANSFGMFDVWWQGILYQSHRESRPLFTLGQPDNSISILFRIDPFMILIGLAGLIFAAIKRDFFILLWTIPFLVFLQLIGYVSFFHLVPLFPAICISAAKLISDLSNKIRKNRSLQILPFAIISGIGIFGLTITLALINTNINSTHFEAAAIIAQHLPDTKGYNAYNNSVTVIIGEYRFFWIPDGIFQKHHYYISYWDHISLQNQTGMVVSVAEGTFNYWKRTDVDKKHVTQLLKIFNDSRLLALLNNDADLYDLSKYPYRSMDVPNPGIGRVEIRANKEASTLFQDILKDVRLSKHS